MCEDKARGCDPVRRNPSKDVTGWWEATTTCAADSDENGVGQDGCVDFKVLALAEHLIVEYP